MPAGPLFEADGDRARPLGREQESYDRDLDQGEHQDVEDEHQRHVDPGGLVTLDEERKRGEVIGARQAVGGAGDPGHPERVV